MDDEEYPMGDGRLHHLRPHPRPLRPLLRAAVQGGDAVGDADPVAPDGLRHHGRRAPPLVAPQLHGEAALPLHRHAHEQLRQPGLDLALGARPPHAPLSLGDCRRPSRRDPRLRLRAHRLAVPQEGQESRRGGQHGQHGRSEGGRLRDVAEEIRPVVESILVFWHAGNRRVERRGNVDRDGVLVRLRRFQCRELAVEQRFRHEVALSRAHPLADQRTVSRQVNEQRVLSGSGPDAVAIGPLQGRTADDDRPRGIAKRSSDSIQPGPAVVIAKRDATRHLVDIGRGMKAVPVDERKTGCRGEHFAHCGLAAAGHAHDDDLPVHGYRLSLSREAGLKPRNPSVGRAAPSRCHGHLPAPRHRVNSTGFAFECRDGTRLPSGQR